MEKQISIIIPTYNMEAYIGKCLDSLLIPEFDQVEVLVVNDGSKDRSSEIAHSYADRYPESIRVIDKPNGNYGSCINAALPQCTGRYVKVLDADDTFDTAAFSKLVNALKSIDDDVVITPYKRIDFNNNLLHLHGFQNGEPDYGDSYNIADTENILASLYIEMHHIAYNRNVFNRFSYHQTEGISYTDNEWAVVPLSYCQTICFLDVPVYSYRIGREGQTVEATKIPIFISTVYEIFENLYNKNIELKSTGLNRTFFLKRLIERYRLLYRFIVENYSDNIIRTLSVHDQWLCTNFPECYDEMGSIWLYPTINYSLIRDLRKKNYPADFRIPFRIRLYVSLEYKIKTLFKR